jgi:hypothetical protein
VNGVGDTPNMHDILTGSRSDGTAFPPDEDLTCGNWTSSTTGSAQVGHHDRRGLGEGINSWNSTHATSGCSQKDLEGNGGAGLFYCFAVDLRSRLRMAAYRVGSRAKRGVMRRRYRYRGEASHGVTQIIRPDCGRRIDLASLSIQATTPNQGDSMAEQNNPNR